MGALRRSGPQRAEIKRMRVAPASQRRGFGRRVLEHLETRAAELGYTRLHLDTTAEQRAAQALYRSHGYRETAREQRARFELIFYEKQLGGGEPDRRKEEVDALIERAGDWAATRPDVRALALVGSWARGDADHDSDVDLVVLVDQPDALVSDEAWLEQLGASSVVRTKVWGALTERRLALPSGLEIDVGIALLSWAGTAPIDAGTRHVVTDGIRIVFDPDGLLARLIAATRR